MSTREHRHIQLPSGSVLTLCVEHQELSHTLFIGWAVYNHDDPGQWKRTTGNQIARVRVAKQPIAAKLSMYEPRTSRWLTVRALQEFVHAMYANPEIEPDFEETISVKNVTPAQLPKRRKAEIVEDLAHRVNLYYALLDVPGGTPYEMI